MIATNLIKYQMKEGHFKLIKSSYLDYVTVIDVANVYTTNVCCLNFI